MAIRLSGMSSGLDTESIVSALVSGYKTKKEKYQKAQTKLSWTQDAWKDVNKKVYSLYSGLDSLRFSSGYALKKTTVSDPSKVSVSASGAAFNGTQKLKVNKVATTATMTGGNLGSTTTGSTKLAELGFTTNNGQITLKKGDGKEATFTAKSSSTVNDFVNFLKNNGITASYDTTQHRIYANAKDQGSVGDFTLTAQNSEGLKAMSALGVNLESEAATKVYKELAQYANTGTDADPVYNADSATVKNNIIDAISAYKTAAETIDKASAANANLQAAGSYAANYATMRDGLKDIGLTEDSDDVETLRKMLRLSSSGFSNSIVGNDGNIYALAGGTADGDTVYSYKDKDTDEEKFISRHMTGDVLSEDGTKYKKLDTKRTFGSDDNEIDVYQKDGDDKLYRLTSDYKLVEIEQAEGQTYYRDKTGGESIIGEPEMEYYTYAGSAKADLGVYTDASGNKFTQYVDDEGNAVDGIFKNGDKYYTAAESIDNTDPENPVTTYTLTEVKLREGGSAGNASDYETVNDDEGNPVTREATSFKADGDYYFVNNSNTTADSSIKASYKWMDEFYDAAQAAHNASAADEDDWDDAARDRFRDKFNDAVQQVNYFEDHNTKDLDELHSENDPDPAYAAYSVQSIMDAVKSAYDNAEPGKGAEAVNAYAEGLGAHMYTNKQAIDSAKATQEKYSNLSSIAAMDTSTTEGTDAYNAAIDDLVSKVLNAADVVNNAANAGYNTDAAKVDGVDASITLGGIEYTSSTNNFSINGLSIQTLAETKEGEEISITTQTDTQGLYDKIKDFITNYNDVINELTELYNASSSKGYDPLTEDEKAEMSDKQIEQWETKIKDSLLRRDQNLGNIITTMTNAMSKSYSVGGKNYSLASFGIKTLGILKAANNQQNAYHIDGDEDDTITSANADKLMNMLTSDPDTVVSFMQQLTNGIHSSMEQKMRTSTLSSAYTIYNDKEMASEYSDYTKLIKTWETRMNDAESRYQKQFTQMEKALAQLNSNSSAVSGLFG